MRVRFRYGKTGKVRFLSHRDLARVIERAVRRAGLPVAYSEGFNPHPRLRFGLAISVGYESWAEYLDIDLDPSRDGLGELEDLPGRLGACLPDGVDVATAIELAPGTPSLQDAVTSCTWRLDLPGADPGLVAAEAARLLAATELPLEIVRKGKQVSEDLRPLLGELVAERTPVGARLTAELRTKPRSVRPAELLGTLRLPAAVTDLGSVRVTRTHQWITIDGERREPIPLAAPSPHEGVRAS
jgi:radical SAM-linked protein